MGLKTRDCHKL